MHINKRTVTVLFHNGHNPSHDMLEVNGFYLDQKNVGELSILNDC